MSPTKSILPLTLGGLLIGLMLGSIVAGAYASWVVGRDLTNIGFTTILDFVPRPLALIPNREPIRSALAIWGAIAAVMAIAIPALSQKRQLTSHGSARWALKAEMTRDGLMTELKTLNGPIFAKCGSPNSKAPFFSSRDIPHCLVSAPTGTGKTRSIVIPTLLTYPGSIFALDVKGELFAKTSRRRVAFGDKVFKFSPLDDNDRTHRYNPLQVVVDTHPRRRFTEARRVASSFIIAHGTGQGFLEGARDIFTAAAIHVLEQGTPTIGAIFDALSQPGDAFATMRNLGDRTESEEAKKIFYKMSGLEARVLSSYLSVLGDGGLNLWANPAIREATSASDFTFTTLRSDPASIYFVVSDNDLVDLAPLVRLLFQQAITILKRAEPDLNKGEKYTVLFCLDEFASLGRMDTLLNGIATLRSYGGRVMIVLQTLAQLRKHYDKDGETIFLGNCRVQLFMSAADEETARYVSAAVGDFTRKSRSKSWKGGDLSTSYQEREDGAPLIRPEQVRMLGKDTILALVQDSYPIIAKKVIYYDDKILKPIYDSQSGPLPEPPALFDEPDEDLMEPIVPPSGDGGAANPLAKLRPKAEPAEAPEPSPAPVAPSSPSPVVGGAPAPRIAPQGDGPAANDAEAEQAAVERETSRAERFRDKSRVILMSVNAARTQYDATPKDEEGPVEDPKPPRTDPQVPPVASPKSSKLNSDAVSAAHQKLTRDSEGSLEA